MWYWGTVRQRYLLIIILAGLLVGLAVIYNSIHHRQLVQKTINTNALRLAWYAASDQYKYIELSMQLLGTLAQQQVDDNRFSSSPTCTSLLLEQIKLYPFLSNLGVIGNDGYLLCSSLPFPQELWLGDRDYYVNAMRTKEFVIGNYQIGRITESSSINLAYPVIAENGTVEAIVYGALNLAWLSDNITDITHAQNASIILFDDQGTVLANHSLPEDDLVSIKDVVQKINHKNKAGLVISADHEGNPLLYAYTPFLAEWDKGMYLAVVSSLDTHLEHNGWQIMALLMFVLFLLAAWLWFTLRRWILDPLRTVGATASRLLQGDYAARNNLSTAGPEVGDVARSMNCLAVQLEQQAQDGNKQADELNRTHRALQTLSGGNHALLRAVDEKILLQQMCDLAVNTAGYKLAWVGYAEEDKAKSVSIVASAGDATDLQRSIVLTWDTSDKGYGPTGTAIRTGKSAFARGLQTAHQYRHWHDINHQLGIQSAVSLPLMTDRKVFGAFTIFSDDPDAFLGNECSILEEMAADLAFGINTLRTNQKQLESERLIHEMAHYDALTKLPNYTQFLQWLHDKTTSPDSTNKPFTLLLFGVNRLREINGTLGYEAGNWVLQETAKRLRWALPDDGLLARLHGDEFGILLNEAELSHTEQLIHALHGALNELYQVDNYTLMVKGSFGIAFFPKHGLTPENLMGMADKALQQAKTSGNLYEQSEPGNEGERKRLLSLAARLHNLLKENKLLVYYQPKVSFTSGRVVGFEALSRWWDSSEGMIAPDTFINLAEKTGMIRDLSVQVFEEVARQSYLWRQQGINLPIAINLSARNLHDKKLLESIEKILTRWRVSPGMLEVEITESAIMEDTEAAHVMLSRFGALGIKIYVDDYGTGFSSLAILKKQPIDALKIDKSFVMDMLTDHEAAVIVASTIKLGHDLGLKIVAEGVENEAVWSALSQLGCDTGQGYHMGKPMPPENVTDWLQQSVWGLAGE